MDFVLLDKMEDQRLIETLKHLSQKERRLQSLFLKYLNEVDSRMLYAKQGYSSLFAFVVEVLRYSEASALKRIQVARLAKKFPCVYSYLERGELTLTALMKLSPYVCEANARLLFEKSRQKSVREVESILAALSPSAEKKDSIKPLAEDRIFFSFSADKEFQTLVEEAKALLSHKYPEGKLCDILKESLRSLLVGIREKRVSKLPRPIEQGSRHIPKHVKELVWEQEGGSCGFMGENGKRCGSTKFLEWDHQLPWSLGGKSDDPSNISLLCRTHNRLMAHRVFGQAFIEKKIREKSDAKDEALRMNRFMLDLWASGGMGNYKKLINSGRH